MQQTCTVRPQVTGCCPIWVAISQSTNNFTVHVPVPVPVLLPEVPTSPALHFSSGKAFFFDTSASRLHRVCPLLRPPLVSHQEKHSAVLLAIQHRLPPPPTATTTAQAQHTTTCHSLRVHPLLRSTSYTRRRRLLKTRITRVHV